MQIKTETADCIRAAAPRLGLFASAARNIVAPGVEVLELPQMVESALVLKARAGKVSVDTMIKRIVGRV